MTGLLSVFQFHLLLPFQQAQVTVGCFQPLILPLDPLLECFRQRLLVPAAQLIEFPHQFRRHLHIQTLRE
jgi:hypothetical protein